VDGAVVVAHLGVERGGPVAHPPAEGDGAGVAARRDRPEVAEVEGGEILDRPLPPPTDADRCRTRPSLRRVVFRKASAAGLPGAGPSGHPDGPFGQFRAFR
jgi:hypothetical protein